MPGPDEPARVLLLGDPVGHSLSAVFQNAAFQSAGIRARYEALRVPPPELASAIASIRSDERVLGANVTIPHKLTVGAHLDQLEASATSVGAVNTISRDGDRLLGHNTDRVGFARSLGEAGVGQVGVALVLGAGGAAAAVAAELKTRAGEVLVAARTAAGAHAVCELVGLDHSRPIAFDDVDRVLADRDLGVDLVVNATPIGLDGAGIPLDPSGLRRGQTVVDLVYRPVWTPLLQAARHHGAAAVNGLGMLLYQGAASFEIWTRTAAPLKVMRAALEGAAGGPVHGGGPIPR
ncbi:MAG TPA: shikimate dehydrogenase [Candidatus Limnocylindrales bacterium]|nr:shikimate dehydrogenase [Candidatus Limnocylindrales bacterium]